MEEKDGATWETTSGSFSLSFPVRLCVCLGFYLFALMIHPSILFTPTRSSTDPFPAVLWLPSSSHLPNCSLLLLFIFLLFPAWCSCLRGCPRYKLLNQEEGEYYSVPVADTENCGLLQKFEVTLCLSQMPLGLELPQFIQPHAVPSPVTNYTWLRS